MRYTEAQKVEILKAPKNKAKIKKALYYEKELRLYTEAQDEGELSNDEAFLNLRSMIKKRLPNKSYNRVLDFIEYPLGAIDLTNSLLVKLYKVFQAKNTFFSHEIDSEQKNKVFREIIKELDVHQFIIENGKEVLKNKPNTIIVVDKSAEGKPYLITVETERLIDADVREDGTMTYIVFNHSTTEGGNKKIAFYDEVSYNVYLFDIQKQTYILETSVEHKIGYCPARCFIKTPLNSKNYYKRETPIGTSIGKVREWQLFTVYKYYAEHFASFPIIEMMKGRCSNEECNNGMIPHPNGIWFEDNIRRELPPIVCPNCSSSEGVGVGTIIKLKPKQGEEDNGKGAFRFIAPEITGINYLSTKLEKLEVEIELKTVGQNNEVLTEAVNETQVKGSFQSRETVLLDLKELFEEIYIWICETSARAYFLGDVQVLVYANFGTEFYLVSEDDLQKRFEYAKKIGLPESEVDAIYKQLILTKYKDNPNSILRMELLQIVDPIPYANPEEVDKLRAGGVITEQEFIIKKRFISFVNRLEFENANLVTFGKKLSLSERVKTINNILTRYANEYIKANNPKPIDKGDGSVKEV